MRTTGEAARITGEEEFRRSNKSIIIATEGEIITRRTDCQIRSINIGYCVNSKEDIQTVEGDIRASNNYYYADYV